MRSRNYVYCRSGGNSLDRNRTLAISVQVRTGIAHIGIPSEVDFILSPVGSRVRARIRISQSIGIAESDAGNVFRRRVNNIQIRQRADAQLSIRQRARSTAIKLLVLWFINFYLLK